MRIDLTDVEVSLLVQTLEASTYPGKVCRLVADLLDKLHKEPNLDQTIKQVWFCGMHSDVGGSYEEEELSRIPLIWMVTEAKERGLLIWPENKVPVSPKANGTMHNSRTGFPGVIYRRRERSWNHTMDKNPTVHESVVMRTHNGNDEGRLKYDPWILRGDYEVEPWPKGLQDIDHLG